MARQAEQPFRGGFDQPVHLGCRHPRYIVTEAEFATWTDPADCE